MGLLDARNISITQDSLAGNFGQGLWPSYFDYFFSAMPTSVFSEDKSSKKKSYIKTSSSAYKALQIARGELNKGVREIGTSNDSIDIRKYKNGEKNNKPWCASFFSYLYGKGQGSSNNATFGYTESSQEIKNKADNAGYYAYKNSGYKPKPGDAAIWTNVKDPAHGHIGIVDETDDKGVWIIEGNAGDAVKRNYYTYEKLRTTARFNGYAKMNEWTSVA